MSDLDDAAVAIDKVATRFKLTAPVTLEDAYYVGAALRAELPPRFKLEVTIHEGAKVGAAMKLKVYAPGSMPLAAPLVDRVIEAR